MTSNIIENMARAIIDDIDSLVMDGYIGEEYPEEAALRIAETALDSLPIIILPHDAEPEIGDLIFDGEATTFLVVTEDRYYEGGYDQSEFAQLHIAKKLVVLGSKIICRKGVMAIQGAKP